MRRRELIGGGLAGATLALAAKPVRLLAQPGIAFAPTTIVPLRVRPDRLLAA